MSTRKKSKLIALLVCGHAMSVRVEGYDAFPSEKCTVCGTWELVEVYYRTQWHSRCTECRYSATHGQAQTYANNAAARHYARTGHNVLVQYYSDAPPSVIPDNIPVQTELPIDPPF